MFKTALIIQGVLLLLLIFGLLLIAIPERVDHIQKQVLRWARALSVENVNKPLGARGVTQSRIVGIIYLVVCVLVLANMQFQFGAFSAPTLPTWTSRVSPNATLEQRIRAIVQPAMTTRAGMVVAAIAGDERVIIGFGRSDLAFDQPPNGDTVFELGSISKVFTGALLASEIAQGEVTLDTPITALLPPDTLPANVPAQRITLKHLVTHTAGLPRTPAQTFTAPQLWRTAIAADTYRAYTDADVLSALQTASTDALGEKFKYSNVGFGILGLALSQRIGKDYHTAVQTRIAQPLGMRDTGVTLTSAQRARLARGYRADLHLGSLYVAQVAAPWEFTNALAGAGGLRSTANDMLIFLAANLGRQTTELTPTLQRTHPVLFMQGETQIGMAWLHARLPKSSQPIIWHNGETGGYVSFIGLTADYRCGVVILSNSTDSIDNLGTTILDALALGQ